ncbi:Mitochondrial import receptor subunit Tom6, fungal [Teratosphaeria destructans]|uniref:Mitochondrial import receptor subunit Tom6, fungal n=1 Tax=Teratosphaeria destructans TaxID=418781 RepID=A0A9W7SW32_9PEZI|nr:Mitochondrial import receptor subunit Tom6, fungal [Teratosphaeria destructans]
MPPKGAIRGGPLGRPQPKGGYARQVYEGLTSPENRTVVTSIAFFAAGVAFLHSSWSEILLPPSDSPGGPLAATTPCMLTDPQALSDDETMTAVRSEKDVGCRVQYDG